MSRAATPASPPARVFLDANVLFSAVWTAPKPNGLSVLLDCAACGMVELLTSSYAVDEARRNLLAKRTQCLPALSQWLTQVQLVHAAADALLDWATSLGVPAKDAPILASAKQANCSLLLTGDVTHFGHLHGLELAGLRVATPAQGLRWLLES